MKNNLKCIICTVAAALILASCGNTSEEAIATTEQSQNSNSSHNTTSTSVNANSTEYDTNAEDDTNKNEKDISATNTESLKEEYLVKLNNTKKETDEMRNNPTDDSTYALKNMEGQIYDIWDGMLNEIYDVLKQQLPSKEMDLLRDEQRKWLDYRDQTALEASLKYKGGTMEHLEYVMVLNNLTEERCFELVNNYMN